MGKTTTAKRAFKIVDLIRQRDSFDYIEVPKFSVEVVIEVTTTGTITAPKPAPSAVFDRLEATARAKLGEYETTITQELVKIEGKIRALTAQPSRDAQKQAEQMVESATAMVKKALASAEPAARQAIEDRLNKEAQGDKLLTEARVKTGFKFVSGTISLSANVVSLVGTAGADVKAYLSIAKTLVDLGLEIKQQLKGEEKLRSDLKAGVNAFLDTRSTVIVQALKRQQLTDTSGIPRNPRLAIQFIVKGVMAAGEEVTKGRDAGGIAREVTDFVIKGIKGKVNDAESARVAYRNHTVKMRQNVDSVSVKADELMKAMKAATNLKEGVRIGSECMKLKGKVRTMADGLRNAEVFLSEMQEIMKAGGLECDDTTVIQKLQRLDWETIKDGAKEISDTAQDIYGLISDLA